MKLRDTIDIIKNLFAVISTILAILIIFSDVEKIDQISNYTTGYLLNKKIIYIIISLLTAISVYSISNWFFKRRIKDLILEKNKIEKLNKDNLNSQNNKSNLLKEELELEKGEHRRTKLTLDNYKRHVYEVKREQLTDLITGIPNDRMLKVDLERMIKKIEHGRQLQMIFIDFDNFKSVNDKYSYYKGDELIKLIAQNLHNGMRRNEEIYKKTFIEDDDEPLTNSVYRKYTGGDEFIILVQGKQFDAVGLLNRISNNLQELSLTVKSKLKIDFDLKFKAVILQVYSADGFSEQYYQDIWKNRISQGLRKIKQKEYPYKVYWDKKKEKKETFELHGLASNIYKMAKVKFRKKLATD